MDNDRERPRAGAVTVLVTPLLPAPGGNGLAMRAGVLLDAARRDGPVVLWVVPVASGGPVQPGPWIRERVDRLVVAELEDDPHWSLIHRIADNGERARAAEAYPRPALARFATGRAVTRLLEALGGRSVDRIVVLRSYLAPFALPLLQGAASGASPGLAVLDLDDDESVTRRRLAGLHRDRGDARAGALELREADRFEALERDVLPSFHRVLVCHRDHRPAAAGAPSAPEVHVVPNAVALPRRLSPRPAGDELRLLLVGNLSYLPNRDAAEVLVREILPRLREECRRPVRVRLVGSSPPPAVRALADRRGVELVADAPSVTPHYTWADLAVVPLRAGGGSRIKILEAFAHGVPVVATDLAAEGLDAEGGRHLLTGRSPEELASACLRLHRDDGLAPRLRRGALELVRHRYERSRVVEALRRALSPPGTGATRRAPRGDAPARPGRSGPDASAGGAPGPEPRSAVR